MAGSVNKVILVGNLGRDPEIRSTQTGQKIASFTLATSESWKDKQTGERRESVEWHRIVVFNDRIAELVERYLHKGDQIYLEGSLQTRKWQDQSGQDRYSTEIVIDRFRGELTFLRTRNDEERFGADGRPSRAQGSRSDSAAPARGSDWKAPADAELDDEVPF